MRDKEFMTLLQKAVENKLRLNSSRLNLLIAVFFIRKSIWNWNFLTMFIGSTVSGCMERSIIFPQQNLKSTPYLFCPIKC